MAIQRERVKEPSRGHVGASSTLAGTAAITSDEFDLFEGGDKANVTLCVAPALVRYVADESRKEADVSKAARKAREEQLMAATRMQIDDAISAALGRSGNGGGNPVLDANGEEVEGKGNGRRRRKK